MKTLAIYYSYTGNTKKEALKIAEEMNADSYEVKDVSPLGKAKAYTWGCYKALRMQCAPIQPIGVQLDTYDRIVILAPVWAGYPAPQILSVIEKLPKGKAVSFRAVSASGASRGKDKALLLIAKKDCASIDYQDIKA